MNEWYESPRLPRTPNITACVRACPFPVCHRPAPLTVFTAQKPSYSQRYALTVIGGHDSARGHPVAACCTLSRMGGRGEVGFAGVGTNGPLTLECLGGIFAALAPRHTSTLLQHKLCSIPDSNSFWPPLDRVIRGLLKSGILTSNKQ